MNKTRISMLAMISLLFLNSCTNLTENVLDESSATGLTDKQVADGNLAPVYARLPDVFTHTTYFAIQEISTDEAILPYRGGTDWGDNGIYVALHQHVPSSTDPNIRNTWLLLAQCISRSITAINTLPTTKDPNVKVYIAEARGMRAYYNMLMLDLFGLVFAKEDPQGVSEILRSEKAIEYVKSEFLAVEPDLLTNVGPGRLTKGAVWGLLARLYLNAAVYRDRYAAQFTFKPEDMDKVIEYSDKIINSGQYQLSKDYFALFNSDNHDNVNTIRAARTNPAPALTSMNLDLLLRERGFELYWELQRRTDLVRFGKFEDSWTEKNNTDRQKRIFPIPQTAIDGASNLPGYLVQNPSY